MNRRPNTGRMDRGRWHDYLLDGQKVPGVTTLIGDGVPKPALANWAAKSVAEWMADNLGTTVRDLDRDALVDLAKGAPWRDRDQAANRGSEIHRYAEQLSSGGQLTWDEIPAEIRGHVEQYLLYRDDWHPEDLAVEAVVASRRHLYMGTVDWWGRLGRAPDLGLVLGDVKTGRSGVFGEVSLQLAAYRYADFYLDPDGAETPMPTFDTVCVLWLGADRYELRQIDAGPERHRDFLYAAQIARFQTETSKQALAPPMPLPALVEDAS